LISRKAIVRSCAYSERISCSTAHIPIFGGAGGSGRGDVPRYNEIFVESMATTISRMNGIDITRVNKPDSTSNPPTISRHPTKSAVKCGTGIPSLVNRPTPWFA